MLGSILLLKKLKKHLSLNSTRLEQIQLKKLKALIMHAYHNVPYYRKLFDSVHLKPEDIRTVNDIRLIPVTDKAALRGLELSEKTAGNVNIENCLKVFTSGSTGMPTNIYYTHEDYRAIDLTYLRSFLHNGLRFTYKRAFILDPHSFETKKRWYHHLGLAAYENVSCFAKPREQVIALRKIKPDFIHGYPSSLALAAAVIIEEGITDIRPSLVSTAAELLHSKDRELINKAFDVELYDRYAARECGNIAWECDEHREYHINIDTCVVEITNGNDPVNANETGDVVITNLHSYAMPFIRYKIGDIGILSERKCLCGVELPLMRTVEGRDEDFITLNDGRRISPMMVTGTLDFVPGIKQFRVVQENMEEITVLLAKGNDFGQDTISKAEKGLKDIFGNGIKIKCNAVEEIPRENSVKVRAVISKVSAQMRAKAKNQA
jgi:phenylacetate-CoA ligase